MDHCGTLNPDTPAVKGMCCGCEREFELEELEGVIVVKSHRNSDGEICDGSHQPPVVELREIPD